jgi:hypothetical protein
MINKELFDGHARSICTTKFMSLSGPGTTATVRIDLIKMMPGFPGLATFETDKPRDFFPSPASVKIPHEIVHCHTHT